MYPEDSAPEHPQGAAGSSGRSPDLDWNLLPDPVRHRLAPGAGTALAALPPAEVPAALRQFARFTPAKRARLGGTHLVRELRDNATFRTAVVAWWEEHRPGELAAGPDEPLTAAAAAVLTGAPGARGAVA